MKIRVEVSSLATKNPSGVANYTKLLTEALDKSDEIDVYATYFNFFNRQIIPNLSIKNSLEKNNLIPLRVYAKLQSFNIAPPFDIFKSNVDLTIFPNFATWPTVRSKFRAVVIHDLTYQYFPEVVESKNLAHLRRVVPRSIKQADIIITISESVRNEIIKEFSIDPNKCIVTTIPPDEKYYKKNNNEIHKKYKIPTKKFIFFIGNLEPRKDLPTLISAYQLLPKEIKNEYSLVLAGGNGWKTEKSRQAINQARENNEKVIHVGFVDEKDASAFYQQASLFVMPSIYEGFGMPILEAFASDCPVIASGIPVLQEVAGNAALYAKVGDSNSFCINIQKLLKSNLLREELIKKGKKQLNYFSWDKNVDIIINKVNSLSKNSKNNIYTD